ncbi:MAG: hypothetical protein ACK2UO_22245 [Caldilineaceae bacterium]
MLPHIDPGIPVAVVGNFVEAHYDFLSRFSADDSGASLFDQEAYHGDRTLLWLGDPKLVFVSHEIPHAAYLCGLLGYEGTRHVAPTSPTPFLSCDILREERLLNTLVHYAGPQKRLQIVPYATTPDFLSLVQVLRCEFGLDIILPECPSPESLWLRDYVDSKSGFHHLAGRWLRDSDAVLPEAYICRDVAEAAKVAGWFHARGRICIGKPDTGESGLGCRVLPPTASGDAQAIADMLQGSPYWGGEPILVEEFIGGDRSISPSVEVFVPHSGAGEPTVTYVSEQLFQRFGEFSGVLVSRDQSDQPWYAPCVENCLRLARALQARGYAGHFDVDVVVDDEGRPYLLELNARRTGGTHVHDFGCFCFGQDYREKVALLSWESLDCGSVSDWCELLVRLDGLLFPLDQLGVSPRGVIVTITSSLVRNQFGVVIVGEDRQDALQLQESLRVRLSTMQCADPVY